jgi:hypothetical protein
VLNIELFSNGGHCPPADIYYSIIKIFIKIHPLISGLSWLAFGDFGGIRLLHRPYRGTRRTGLHGRYWLMGVVVVL